MLYLRTFAGLVLEKDGRPLGGAAGQRGRLALLAVLAKAGSRGVSRDKLLAYFWPEHDEERARAALSQALYALRRAAGADSLFLGTTELRLDPGAIASDVERFEAALARGELEAAVELYAGPFLDGIHVREAPEFERWVDRERDRLADAYRRALEGLARTAEERSDFEGATRWWRELSLVEPLSSRVALGLMRALAAAGQRGAALRHARTHAQLVRLELGTGPDLDVEALAEALRDRAPPSGTPAATPARISPDHSQRPEVVGSAEAVEHSPSEAPSASPLGPRAPALVALAGAAMVALALGRLLAPPAAAPVEDSLTEAPDLPVVVVLPFETRLPEPSFAPFGQLAADWIIHGLVRSALVDVVPLERAAAFLSRARGAESASDIGAQSERGGAGAVVRGFLLPVGDSLQIHAEVTDLAGGKVLAAIEPVVVPISAPLEGLEPLRQRVMGILASRVHPQLARWSDAVLQPPTYDAYLAFLQGMEARRRGAFLEAVEHLRRAQRLDTTFVSPLLVAVNLQYQLAASPEDRRAADSTLAILSRHEHRLAPAERHALLARRAQARGNRDGAYHAMREAARLSPERYRYGFAAAALYFGRYQEAADAFALVDPDPERHPNYWKLYTVSHHFLGDHERELQLSLEAQRQGLGGALGLQAWALAGSGRLLELQRVLDQIETRGGARFGGFVASLAHDLRLHGHSAAAAELFRRAFEWYDRRPPPAAESRASRAELHEYGVALYRAGRWAEALAVFHETAHGPTHWVEGYLGWLGVAAARAGDAVTADSVGRELRAWDTDLALFQKARIHAVLGRKEESLRSLREALARGYGHHLLHLEGTQDFQRYFDDPRVRELFPPPARSVRGGRRSSRAW